MNRLEYRKIYLRSSHWRSIRNKYIKDSCYCCGDEWSNNEWNKDENNKNTERLELHHINYNNLGKEKEQDFVTVCSICHDNIHEIAAFRAIYVVDGSRVRACLNNAHKIHRNNIYKSKYV